MPATIKRKPFAIIEAHAGDVKAGFIGRFRSRVSRESLVLLPD
jgi:hypothetical protein